MGGGRGKKKICEENTLKKNTTKKKKYLHFFFFFFVFRYVSNTYFPNFFLKNHFFGKSSRQGSDFGSRKMFVKKSCENFFNWAQKFHFEKTPFLDLAHFIFQIFFS